MSLDLNITGGTPVDVTVSAPPNISVQSDTQSVTIARSDPTAVSIAATGGANIEISDARVGPPGPPAQPGPGFKVVGSELRYDISSLPKG